MRGSVRVCSRSDGRSWLASRSRRACCKHPSGGRHDSPAQGLFCGGRAGSRGRIGSQLSRLAGVDAPGVRGDDVWGDLGRHNATLIGAAANVVSAGHLCDAWQAGAVRRLLTLRCAVDLHPADGGGAVRAGAVLPERSLSARRPLGPNRLAGSVRAAVCAAQEEDP